MTSSPIKKQLNDGQDIEIGYLNDPYGQIFALWRGAKDTKKAILFIPPFGEEMNRSRHLMAKIGQNLAAYGIGSLLIDYYGTGDSSGGIQDANIEIWQSNIKTAHQALVDQGVEHIIWVCIRFGTLLAANSFQNLTRPPSQIFAIAPQKSGKKAVHQWFRAKIAASAFSESQNGTKKIRAEDIRNDLKLGRNVELSGYQLSPHFIQQTESLDIEPLAHIKTQHVVASPSEADALFNTISAQVIPGPPLWNQQEPDDCAPYADALSTAILEAF